MPLRLLIFLAIINILNYLDRYIVHSVEPLIKSDFNLNNEQSAILVTAFTYGYFICSPWFGALGCRFHRPLLMGIGVILWSLATAASGLATGFYAFFAARIAVGIGEASFGTIIPGYLKDRINDPVKLNSTFSFFYAAIPVGAALGFFLGGLIAQKSSWHNVFFVAAVPGLILGIALLFIKEAPKTDSLSERLPVLHGLKLIAARPVLLFTMVGYVFNTFALNGIAPFIARYGQSIGFDGATITQLFGLILLVTGFGGTVFGGQLSTYLAKRNPAQSPEKHFLRFIGLSSLFGVPFLVLAFAVPDKTVFLACCFLAQLLLFAGVAPVNSILVQLSPKGFESLTQGVTIFLINLFGSILGPYLVGLTSDYLLVGTGLVGSAADLYALPKAIQLCSVAMALSGVIWLCGIRTFRTAVAVDSSKG